MSHALRLPKASYLSSLQLIYQSPSRRQHDDERRPFSRLRPRRNPPFVTVGDRLADRKSDSSAGEIGLIVEPLERLEDRSSELLFEPYAIVLFQFPLVGVMSFSKINSEQFKSPVTGTRVLEILCVKNRPERPLRSLIAKAHSQKPNCSTPIKAKKS